MRSIAAEPSCTCAKRIAEEIFSSQPCAHSSEMYSFPAPSRFSEFNFALACSVGVSCRVQGNKCWKDDGNV